MHSHIDEMLKVISSVIEGDLDASISLHFVPF